MGDWVGRLTTNNLILVYLYKPCFSIIYVLTHFESLGFPEKIVFTLIVLFHGCPESQTTSLHEKVANGVTVQFH